MAAHIRQRIKAVKSYCIKMHKKHPERKFVRTSMHSILHSFAYMFVCHPCLLAFGFRRDKYQRDLKKYWVEKEVEGTYEKAVSKNSTRKVSVNMDDESFSDNDDFKIDAESAASSDPEGHAEAKGGSTHDDEETGTDDESGSDTPVKPKRRRESRGGKRVNAKKPRKQDDHDSDVSVEEPLEEFSFNMIYLSFTETIYVLSLNMFFIYVLWDQPQLNLHCRFAWSTGDWECGPNAWPAPSHQLQPEGHDAQAGKAGHSWCYGVSCCKLTYMHGCPYTCCTIAQVHFWFAEPIKEVDEVARWHRRAQSKLRCQQDFGVSWLFQVYVL